MLARMRKALEHSLHHGTPMDEAERGFHTVRKYVNKHHAALADILMLEAPTSAPAPEAPAPKKKAASKPKAVVPLMFLTYDEDDWRESSARADARRRLGRSGVRDVSTIEGEWQYTNVPDGVRTKSVREELLGADEDIHALYVVEK